MSQGPVTSITKLSGAPDEVTVTFQADALALLRDLKRQLSVESEQAVVLLAVQLLASSAGAEIVLRRGNDSEVIRLWQTS